MTRPNLAASFSTRAAKFTAGPMQVKSSRLPPPMLPYKSHATLVQLDVGVLNKRGERFALLAGEVCKGSAGKARELDGKGVEAFADIRLLADGIQFRG